MSQLQYMHKRWGPSECIIHVPRRLFFGFFSVLHPHNCLFMYLLSYRCRYLFIILFIYLFIKPASAYDFNVNWIWHKNQYLDEFLMRCTSGLVWYPFLYVIYFSLSHKLFCRLIFTKKITCWTLTSERYSMTEIFYFVLLLSFLLELDYCNESWLQSKEIKG